MINEIFAKYGSDKLDHDYGPFYEANMPTHPKKLLEIGILKGASIRVWKELYPTAEIHGLDLFVLDPIPDIPDVKFWQGNQTDQFVLEQLQRENFDVVIDDCSHCCRDHWVTLFSLISDNMVYFIEDLHTCKEEFFRQGLPFEDTILGTCLSGKFPFNYILSESERIIKIWK